MGKPLYTDAVADTICERLAGGETLTSICDDVGISRITVWAWRRAMPEFDARVWAARIQQAEALAEQIVDLADAPTAPEDVPHLRARIDARKWAAARLDPARYGDKVQLDHRGTVTLDATQIAARLTVLLGRLRGDELDDGPPLIEDHAAAAE